MNGAFTNLIKGTLLRWAIGLLLVGDNTSSDCDQLSRWAGGREKSQGRAVATWFIPPSQPLRRDKWIVEAV